jgi:hypothetical protein
MSDRHFLTDTPLPLWRRLRRWLGSTTGAARSRSSGLDSARMDLGYEAAYAPAATDSSFAPSSRFEDERPAH